MDLSTGINPCPYPPPSIPQDVWCRLPDAPLDLGLRMAAKDHYGLNNPENILATPGTGAIIRLLPQLKPLGKTAILGPTYSEHAQSWSDAGHHTQIVSSLDEASGADVVIAVNPNNPNGHVITPSDLSSFALAHPNCFMVVDQAYGELYPELSIIPNLPQNMVALASFGKFFGLAGLRLGLVMGAPDILAALASRLGPWPVSGPALFIGQQALMDKDWINNSRAHLSKLSLDLTHVLSEAHLEIIGGTALFHLVQCKDAFWLWDHFGQHGILTRIFSYDRTWLRIGLPPDQGGLNRLADCLANRRQ